MFNRNNGDGYSIAINFDHRYMLFSRVIDCIRGEESANGNLLIREDYLGVDIIKPHHLPPPQLILIRIHFIFIPPMM